MSINRTVLRWSVAILWMMLIFIGSSIPAESLPEGPQFIPIVVHLLEFMVLTMLLIWAINEGWQLPVGLPVRLSAAILAMFFGLLDELHQLFVPGRVSDLLDLAVDGIGVLFALFVAWFLERKLKQRSNKVRESTGKERME